MGRTAVVILVLILASLLAAVAVVYSGVYNIAADKKHWALTTQIIEAARIRSVKHHARDITPPNLDDPQLALKGAGQYAEMCVMCHLAPGLQQTALRQGLYPVPPDLTRRRIDPRETFWVIKHGIKMSAMPAWGPSHDDETLWSIVSFVATLPTLTAAQYEDMVKKAPPHEEMSVGGAPKEPAGHRPHTHSHKKPHKH